MLLFEPPPSNWDLHFRVFGVPVRVHPLFWIAGLITGLGPGDEKTKPAELLIWIAVVFVSILVHEMGHAFLQRRYGGHPWITLHGFGGLASCGDCDRSPRAQILISLAGPTAGFLLAAAVLIAIKLSGHAAGLALGRPQLPGVVTLRLPGATLYFEPYDSMRANLVVLNMLWVNVIWGLVNLLPVYPLDGGRVSREVCTLRQPRRGIVLSLQISIVTAGAMGVYGLFAWQSLLVLLMFGYLAYTNYQALQAYQRDYW
jgi:Zn-dependent protease